MNLTPENTMERILNGEDVTPSCRAEYFVKQAIDNAGSGSGGDTYETVAEIEVGTMEGESGRYAYNGDISAVPQISESETYYLNDASNPSTTVQLSEGSPFVGFNVQFNGGVPSRVNLDEPIVLVVWEKDEEGREHVLVQSDTTDLSNTTVKILKKVSGGGSITVDSELSETSEKPVQNKVITAALANKANTVDLKEPLIVHGTWADNPNTVTITTPLADIYAAAVAGRAVFLEYTEDGTTTRMGLGTRAESNGGYMLGFSISIIASDKPVAATVAFNNTLVGEFKVAAAQ